MRRVLQVGGVAAMLASLVSVQAPATGAQGIVSGITVPPIAAVTPGMPIGVSVAVPSMVTQPIMPGMSIGMAGAGSGDQREVTYKESTTSEPATIVLSEYGIATPRGYSGVLARFDGSHRSGLCSAGFDRE